MLCYSNGIARKQSYFARVSSSCGVQNAEFLRIVEQLNSEAGVSAAESAAGLDTTASWPLFPLAESCDEFDNYWNSFDPFDSGPSHEEDRCRVVTGAATGRQAPVTQPQQQQTSPPAAVYSDAAKRPRLDNYPSPVPPPPPPLLVEGCDDDARRQSHAAAQTTFQSSSPSFDAKCPPRTAINSDAVVRPSHHQHAHVPRLDLRRYAPVWYTGTFWVGLKSYRH